MFVSALPPCFSSLQRKRFYKVSFDSKPNFEEHKLWEGKKIDRTSYSNSIDQTDIQKISQG